MRIPRCPSFPVLPGKRSRLAGLLLALCGFGTIWGADAWFPFVVPGDDASRSFTDLSGWNARPAGADGFVRVDEGHFATEAGRIRFWGVNVCFGANFPSHQDAEKVAAHLAKLGVNLVRFHHHDTAPPPRGLLKPPHNGRRELDPTLLDRQDYFLAQLHRHGIYANLNLHVGRTFTEAEGFLSEGLPRAVRYDKYLLYFEPRMQERFKEFCRAYLTHRNPYRENRRRAEDPGIAMIELTNENPFSREGPEIAAALPSVYREQFRSQWNAWLRARYPSTEALRRAWSARNQPLGAPLADSTAWAKGPDGWRLHQSARYPVEPEFGRPGPTPQIPAVRLNIRRVAPQTHLQEWQFPNLRLEPGGLYTLEFYARADRPRPLYVDVSRQGPADWSSLGLGETVQLDSQWRAFRRVFRVKAGYRGPARICFKFGGDDSSLELAGVRLRPGGEWIVLPEGQSLESGNVDIPVRGWAEPAQEDVRRFMADTERNFIQEMMRFLKEELGVKAPRTASQITYHGPRLVAETCDYADVHAYWEHPRFPRRPWDPVDWFIPNTPMETAPGRDALTGRAPWRLLDRPYTISEWNIPDPNDHAAGVVPFAALVAGLQDWDGVMFFQYQSGEGNWYADHIQRFFSFNGHPAKLVLLTACAPWYRRGDLEPLAETALGTFEQPVSPTLALSRRLGIDPDAQQPLAPRAPEGDRLESPDGRAVWDATDPARAHVRVLTPRSVAVWGRIANQHFSLGPVDLQVGKVDRDYAVVVLTSLDGRPLETSRRMLLAAVGRAQNPGMMWNPERTSVGNRWGHGPAEVNGVPLRLTLKGRPVQVQALDGRGHPMAKVPLQSALDASSFEVGPAHRTLWYGITRR